MALTDAERVDVRRYCGFPLYGNSSSGYQGYRYFQAYGTLEYRMTNMTADEESVVRTTYLTNLATLETAIVGASANLDTDEAAVWKHNKNEVRDRTALFDQWRRKLCGFLGVPPGPELGESGLRIVV